MKLILLQDFPAILTFILGRPIPYYPKERKQQRLEMGKGIHPKYTGVSDLGVFELDHFQPVKLILFQNFVLRIPWVLANCRRTGFTQLIK